MTSLMSVAEAVGRGEEVSVPLEEGVPLVSQADSSKAKRAKEPAGECPGPSCSSLREGPTAVHSMGSPLVLSAPSLLRASYKAVSSGEGIAPMCHSQEEARHLAACWGLLREGHSECPETLGCMGEKQGISTPCRVWKERWPDNIRSGGDSNSASVSDAQAWMQKTGLRWREASSVLYGPRKKGRSFIGSFLIVVGQ